MSTTTSSSGIVRGRRARRHYTQIPDWRIEDQSLDAQEFRIACWLASHQDAYLESHVSRVSIHKHTGVSAGKVSNVVHRLVELGIVEIDPSGPRGAWVITFHEDVWIDGEVNSNGHLVDSDWSPGGQTSDLHLSLLEEQEENPPGTPSGSFAPEGDIEKFTEMAQLFWDKYPAVKDRKRAKSDVIALFVQLCSQGHETQLRDGFKFALKLWSDPEEVKFAPAPLAWLKRKYWDIDLASAPVDRQSAKEAEYFRKRLENADPALLEMIEGQRQQEAADAELRAAHERGES